MNNELYNKHRKQITGLVHKIASKWNGPDAEELPSEAYLLFCKALHSHDPVKASFSTHLHFTVFGGLLSVAQKTNRYRIANRQVNFDRPARYTDFCRALEQREILARLSPDATKLLHNMLNSNITASQPGRKISCRYVCDTFGKSIGWSRDYTERVWAELGRAYEAMSV